MPWEFGSGLRTDYDFTITESYFATDASYQAGEAILLHLLGTDEDGEEVKEIYSVGKDWTSTDGGKTIESTKGGKARINVNSMYARFCQAAISLGIADLLDKRGDVTEAKVWAGLRFHMNEVEQVFGRNIASVFRNMPVAYLGLAGIKPTTPVTPPQSAKISPAEIAAAAKARAAKASTNGSSDLVATITSIAKSSEDFNSFVDQAVTIDGLTEDDELLTMVTDPSDSGFYSLNH